MDPDEFQVGDTFRLGLKELEVTAKDRGALVLENGAVVTDSGVDFPDDTEFAL